MSDLAKVQRWYDARAEWQWGWAERNPVEYGVTLRTLREYLPPPPAAVLDVGGGPGTYAIPLAEQGYRVTLFDLSAASLDVARREATARGVTLDGYVHGTATDLSAFADGGLAAALALGPLYHLLALAARARARAAPLGVGARAGGGQRPAARLDRPGGPAGPGRRPRPLPADRRLRGERDRPDSTRTTRGRSSSRPRPRSSGGTHTGAATRAASGRRDQESRHSGTSEPPAIR